MEKIKELIGLLLADFELENEDDMWTSLQLAVDNPKQYLDDNEAEWLLEADPEGIVQYAVSNEVGEFMIIGDKIDEIHELIVDELEGDLPSYPYEKKLNAADYIQWVTAEIKKEYPELELIEIGDSYGDNIQMMLVYAEDVPRIKELCEALNIRCNRADEILKF
ncbi:hypothetical protein CLV94_0522 [Flavobacterium endophyticum]|uniref:Uncharacterized protein n=1 Tax=Flavobacterium endophyticum TaxID=1540163 RepID=A0A495MJ88_9FLAO|nr:hypothetical protein [Flavobacterium endophyticum]RKS25488.1 hypothetical protein CLV94_0522 [Flavobacterium endophyticum]